MHRFFLPPAARLFLVSQLVTNEPTNYRGWLHEPWTRTRATVHDERAEGKTKEERQHEISDASVTQASSYFHFLSPSSSLSLFLRSSFSASFSHLSDSSPLPRGHSFFLPASPSDIELLFLSSPWTQGTRPCPSRIRGSCRVHTKPCSPFILRHHLVACPAVDHLVPSPHLAGERVG